MHELSSECRDHPGARIMCMYDYQNVHDKYVQMIYMLRDIESNEDQRSEVVSKLLSCIEKSVENAECQKQFDQLRKTIPIVAIILEHHVQVFNKTKSQSVYKQMCAAQCMLSKLCKIALEHNIKSRSSHRTRKVANRSNQHSLTSSNQKGTKMMLKDLIRNAKQTLRLDYESNITETSDKLTMLKNLKRP
jgi:hypothetical protein